MVSCRTLPGSRASSRQAATRSLMPSWVSRALTSTRPPSVLACGWSKRATTGFANPSPWKVTWVIQSVAIEPPCDGVLKRLDTAFIAPARGSVALLFHRSRIFQANEHRWRGLAVYGVDGSHLRIPDTPANDQTFGRPQSGRRGRAGYPQVRIVA